MIKDLIEEYAERCISNNTSFSAAARKLLKEHPEIEMSHRTLRRRIAEQTNKKKTVNMKEKHKEIENLNSKEFNYTGEKSLTTKKEAVEFFGIDLTKDEIYKSVFNSWDVTVKNDKGKTEKRTNYQVKLFVRPKKQDFKKFYAQILDDISKIKTLPKTKERGSLKNPHLLVIDPADVHIGKLCNSFAVGENYDSQTAVKRVIEGVKEILEKSKGFNIDKILFIGGNDILHIDTPKRTTTSGTPQDTDGMWYSNFLLAKQLYIDVINILLETADVHFVYNPSNHDYTNGFFLADVIKTYFKNVDNISFDTSLSYRKYYKYHSNLIGTTHGDGAKHQDLPLLMAHESKDWSNCKHRYIYTHHVHHKMSKDHIGVTIESLRSPSGTDSWHHKKGYTGAPKAVEGFIHHPDFGQVARLTHIF